MPCSLRSLSEGQRFPEKVVRFYSAQLVLALEYLHHVGVVFRDLRPESVLLDRRGYVRLRSLGLCKRLEEGERTFTLCGSPAYRAPEMLLELGYSHPVDWSVSISV